MRDTAERCHEEIGCGELANRIARGRCGSCRHRILRGREPETASFGFGFGFGFALVLALVLVPKLQLGNASPGSSSFPG